MRFTTEPEDMREMIADCADIPHSLDARPAMPLPEPAPKWEVDDTAQAQAADLDEYV